MFSSTPFYNQTTKKAVAVFGTVFNNISITKPNRGQEKVPIAYGPAQKFITRLNDAGSDTDRIQLKVPRMAFEISSFELDSERQLNKMNKHVYSSGSRTVFQGVPYNIGFTLTIIAKDQDSALQIVEQILPTFRPEYTVAIKDMERPGLASDVPIVLNSVSQEDSYEGTYEDSRILTYTLEFNMKIRYFASETTPSGLIRQIDAKFYSDMSPRTTLQLENPGGEENVRVTVNSPDLPPLDSSDTITTTFGFGTSTLSGESTGTISRLVGSLAASTTTQDVYTEASYTSDLNFIRNTSFWGKSIKGLTSISAWNSRDNNKRAGVAITKRHVLFAEHSGFHLSAGDTIYFVTDDNTVISRTISAEVDHPSSGYSAGDFNIAVLNSDLPDTIEIAKVFASDATNYMDFNKPFLALQLDQEEKGLIKDFIKIGSTGNAEFASATGYTDWYEAAISGDSGNPSFVIIDNEAILLSVVTNAGGGSGTFIGASEIGELNTMIATVDAAASISTGYTLTQLAIDPNKYYKYSY